MKIIEVSQLYPAQEGKSISIKLKTLLKQINYQINNQSLLQNNSYLNRLVIECKLFLPEIFNGQFVQHWDYQVAIKLYGNWLQCSIDWLKSPDNQVKIIDWSGIEANPLVVAKAYLLAQRLDISPNNISIVSLIINPLTSDRRINFVKKTLSQDLFMVCEQDLNQRLSLIVDGVDLHQVQAPVLATVENSQLVDIESIPEVVLE
ncbi:MAG: hypothetical protein ACRC80_00505 [Waterburya sp.]